MSPVDKRAHMTSYWRSIVTVALSPVISDIFNVENYRDLEIRVRGHWRSLQVVPFDRMGMISYQCSIVTLSLRHNIWDIRLEVYRDLETRVRVTQGHQNGHGSIREFILTFHSNHGPILYRFRVIRRLPSKITIFSYPRAFRAPLTGFPLDLGISPRSQETRMMGLPEGRKCFKRGLIV